MTSPTQRPSSCPFMRLPSLDETQAQQGENCLQDSWNSAKDCFNKTFNTLSLYSTSSNPYYWVNRSLSRNDGTGFEHYATFYRTMVVTKDPQYIKHILQGHRNDGIFFEGSRGLKLVLETVKNIYPDEAFSEEDCILTCKPENTPAYRSLLEEFFNRNMSRIKPDIEKLVIATLQTWPHNTPINVTAETMLFTSKTISMLFLGLPSEDVHLVEAINFISSYFVKSLSHALTAQEKETLSNCYKTFRSKVDEVLQSPGSSIVAAMREKQFSEAQIKVMIFSLFLLGQETTASLLNYMIWQLAKNPDLQNEIRRDNTRLRSFYVESLREFPPAWILYRTAKQDLLLGEQYVKGGEVLCPVIIAYAAEVKKSDMSWYPFGHGVHKCPGQALATDEIYCFIRKLLEDFDLSTEQQQDLEKVGSFVLRLSEDIFLTVNSRSNPRSSYSH